MEDWSWAKASVIGTSHLKSNTEKQDSLKVNVTKDFFVAAVSDGAGSAKFSKLGSWLTSRILVSCITEYFESNDIPPSEEQVWDWIDRTRDTMSLFADKKKVSRRQFACTLALIAVKNNNYLSISVGDSCAVGRVNGVWGVFDWPENGEYASTTYFITDDPEPKLRFSSGHSQHDAFAVFSDGLNDIALVNSQKTAFDGFFDPMLNPVCSSEIEGYQADLSLHLNAFLESDLVCDRTDDDKTLILFGRKYLDASSDR